MRKFGFRAHDFGSFPSVEALASTISEVQSPTLLHFALNKAVPSARSWKDWDEDYALSIRDTLAKKGITIAIASGYINPVNPDPSIRAKEHVARFVRTVELAKAFGSTIVGTETGSVTLDNSYSQETSNPKNLKTFYESLDQMLNAAIRADVTCAIEAVAKQHTICSIERMARTLEKFNDPHLQVIYDPINLVPWIGIGETDGSVMKEPSHEAQASFYNQAFDAFSSRICAIHCKDYRLDEKGWKIGNLNAPSGVFDWKGFFAELDKRQINVPILLENLNPNTVKADLQTLKAL